MKKINYILLQAIISLLLIGLGVLIELKGQKSPSGTATILMIIPGAIILGQMLTALLPIKKIWQYIIAVFGLCLLFQGISFIVFKLNMTMKFGLVMVITALFSSTINTLFNILYQSLKKIKV